MHRRSERARRAPSVSLVALLAALWLGSPSLRAQDELQSLRAELAAERAARRALEERLSRLEQRLAEPPADDLEAQLAALLPRQAAPPPRAPVSPSAFNPRIGVFMDAVLEGGDFDDKFGEDSDRASLRETEIDFRLPISPFADGVLVFAAEDASEGEFETTVEEGYADISLAALFDSDTAATMKVGRFRPVFGRANALHLHDWMQVVQPPAFRNLVGGEGVVGDGLAFRLPISAGGEGPGTGHATTVDVALVNGEMVTGEETLLGGLTEGLLDPLGDPFDLDSDGSLLTARASHFVELDTLSDLEFGTSHMRRIDNDAVTTSTGTRIDPNWTGVDVTWRQRDDETGVGSWLLQSEWIRADVDFEDAGVAGFPTGASRQGGWWLTAQRQLDPTTYLGLVVGQSDVLGTSDHETSLSPYITWYPDEFFRIRAQIEHLARDVSGGSDEDALRAMLQFTWNFGAHAAHPYWVNR